MAVDFEARQKKGRTRSPSYPYIDLRAALEKAAVLWKVEGRHPAVVNVVMHHWGYKEDSSTGYSCVAALKKFGLVDHEGIGDSREIRLSNLALTVLLDDDPNSAERQDALKTAALNPRIHAELWEKYGPDLPSDQSLKRFLVLEKNFNEAVVDELIEEYKQSLSFAGLDHRTGPVGSIGNGVPASGSHQPAPRPAPADSYDRRQEPAPAAYTPAQRSGTANGSTRSAFVAPAASQTARPADYGANGGRLAAERGRNADDEDEVWTQAPSQPALNRASRPPDYRTEPIRQTLPAHELFEEQRELLHVEPRPPLPPPAEESAAAPAGAGMGSARKELPVPLDNDLVARVPYPMTEEDFTLLLETLQLWKKRLVRPAL